ncbi:response regulator transcription factor [Wenzhouxiangella marina]|uniref:Two-component system, OmpR family, response regulator PhoP n=1 Tax=Wenzhouxiangella marina TaxID=1579979 RepID=A0A0K0XUY4_9GAMM|nr:response regulator transcription factor [Wenzhouxiangella marina]AKS41431.1 Two-component system, OmpR family, response regulator PhoP [Wenzhouxiangella marina]MBB6086815.1 two-component system response regulator PhoP [Wenzhouxiangella marina]
MRLLVIEDDTELRELLGRALKKQGFAVDLCADGTEGLYYATEYPVDLAIVDLGLPGHSGMDIVREVRRRELRFPILVLTARSDWQDKVQALELGADDYVTKPFRLEEVMARVQALLRRSGGHASPIVRFGPLEINLSSQDVRLDDQTLELTSFEYKVLEYFALHPDQVVSKLELNDHLYDEDADPDSNVIEVLVGRLRRKLDPAGDWQPIETLRGRGYRFRAGKD